MEYIDIEKVWQDIPLISFLSKEERDKINGRIGIMKKSKGEYIFRSGDPADLMYIIKTGSMKISMYLSDGREQILYIYNDGDFVGGFNILSSDKYVYNGVAIRDSIIYTIGKEDFHNVFMHNEDFLLSLLEKSYERIRRSEQLIDRLSVVNADMKVAKTLIDLLKIYGMRTDEDDIILRLNLNREEIGSFTGLSRETVSRKLNQFEERKLIEIMPRGKIKIIDLDGLMKMTI